MTDKNEKLEFVEIREKLKTIEKIKSYRKLRASFLERQRARNLADICD